MPQQQTLQMPELQDREISSKGGLITLFAYNTHTNVGCLDHPHIVATVADPKH